MKFYSRFNRPARVQTVPVGESRTQQQFKKECDVNNILAKHRRTGMVTHVNKHQGQFGDFSNLEDYQTSLHKVMTAQNSFNLLPSELRNKFGNDPAQLISYLADPKNDDEAIRFGLKLKPETPISTQESFERALENNDKKRSKKETPK